MRAAERNWLVVPAQTDEVIHGWGEGSLQLKELPVAQSVRDLETFLLGQDNTRGELHDLIDDSDRWLARVAGGPGDVSPRPG
jgi:L-alanine-DL-glutamate epimerase-like enolase superfamily enzyme